MAPRFLFSETLASKEKSDKITLANESRKTPRKNFKLSEFRIQLGIFGGVFTPPSAAKCIRTISRIVHHKKSTIVDFLWCVCSLMLELFSNKILNDFSNKYCSGGSGRRGLGVRLRRIARPRFPDAAGIRISLREIRRWFTILDFWYTIKIAERK